MELENIDLRQFDEDFGEAETEKREFEPVPDGKYQVRVEKAELVRSKTSNNPMLKWTLLILAPDHQGRLLWRNNVIASVENLKWLKTDLATCGLNLKKLSDLPAHLNELLDIHLEVTKKTKGTNENVYFNRAIVLAQGGGQQKRLPHDHSDIPF